MDKLMEKCEVEPIQNYIERRRNKLWQYLENNKRDLMEVSKNTSVPAQNVSKVLWWEQLSEMSQK